MLVRGERGCVEMVDSKSFYHQKPFHGSLLFEPSHRQNASWELVFADRNEQRPEPSSHVHGPWGSPTKGDKHGIKHIKMITKKKIGIQLYTRIKKDEISIYFSWPGLTKCDLDGCVTERTERRVWGNTV